MACRLTLTNRPAIAALHRLTFTDHDKVFHSYASSGGQSERDGEAMEFSARTTRKQSNRLCRNMRDQGVLNKRQYKICRRDPEMPHTLVTAYRDMYTQCKFQFRYERWNCRDQLSRIRLQRQGLWLPDQWKDGPLFFLLIFKNIYSTAYAPWNKFHLLYKITKQD